MLNPVLKNRKYTLGYFAGWLVLACVQLFISMSFYNMAFVPALSEGLIFNALYAVIGIGIWYPVYYTDIEKNKIVNFLINHLASGALAVGLWLWLGYMILSVIYQGNTENLEVFTVFIPARVGIGLLFYVLLVSNYYMIIYYQNFKEKLTRESELNALVKESELSSLKSQINPHFLFNSLNSISSLTMISPERAQDMVINLSEFLRYALSNKKETLTTFENELKNIERYLKIEKIRFGKRLQVDRKIDDQSKYCLLPGLILQPIIENAIKYGIYESTDESNIVIESRIYDNLLEVKVSNEYDPNYMVKKGEGIGIRNVSSRLKIQYSREDLVKVAKYDHIFEIALRFPQKG
jgi:two-component system, LytTR family, sensor kinase